ncbi:hypothetical protein J1605_013126 [Eschrichtius robustus]|uniref:ZZ-type domain-containing protein n=1 Tax=Eschrichtius robustus TaxID=9764 RepID=A0AB34GF99_ESCRO|nr:hypothetical protein J1605_013126 [Eschrichtius robustus]
MFSLQMLLIVLRIPFIEQPSNYDQCKPCANIRSDAVFPLLPAVDLIGSSLIQHVLLRQSLWEARESAVSVQQLFQALQELFQRVRVEKPGQVHPRASELTLSLLTTMYDSSGTGFLKLGPAAAALIALSGDSPLTKYRGNIYPDCHGGKSSSVLCGECYTQLFPRGECHSHVPQTWGADTTADPFKSQTYYSTPHPRQPNLEVLSSAIKEEKFLSWLQSEPPILLWLPTCYRLSAPEMVTHPVRCRICRNFPITGLSSDVSHTSILIGRYRCLKCLNFDICQVCFLSGLQSKSHQKSHPVIEKCIQQMSAKENTKLFLRTLRNNLLQGRCRRKEAARRQWLLDQVNPRGVANHAEAR